jgi:hypothetical protein
MFCSIECRDEFYKYADLSSEKFNKFVFLLKKIAATFGGQKKLNKFINKHSSTSIFDFDFSDPSQSDYLLNIYKCFLSASSSSMGYGEDWLSENVDAATKKLITHIAGILIGNSTSRHHSDHKGRTYDENKKYLSKIERKRNQLTKLCFSTFRAMLNHSCVPSIDFFCVENTAIFYVKEPIKANEQLFISYV